MKTFRFNKLATDYWSQGDIPITLFENDELLPLLTNFHLQEQEEVSYNQLTLFNF